jgi:nucleotide-binding universal stress UspA family protein
MKRILVPVDGSASAQRALRHAIGRAKESRAELHLLHVESPREQEAHVHAAHGDIAAIGAEARQRLLEEAVEEVQKAHLPHAVHLLDGEVAAVIAQFADSQNVDEIVMGTRGLAFGPMLLGSVASRVVHTVRMPVTLVK